MSLSQRALELVSIDSPIGHEKAIADFVEAWARKHFQPQHIFRHSHSMVLGDLNDNRPTLALIGHLDTVPAHASGNVPRIEGDRLFGLGSSDMKGALAVMMALCERLPLASLPYNVVLVLYEREEGPYLESGLGPLFEKVPGLRNIQLGIAMEPTDNVVQVGCVGSVHATVTFSGRSAHSARPWQGENAIHQAGPVLVELLALPRKEVVVQGYSFFEVFSVTRAQGGRARNVVPDVMELNVNYRFAPGKSVEEARDDVLRLIAGRARVEFTDLSPSGRVCTDNTLLKTFLSLTQVPATSKQAWTDVARFSQMGIDAVNFGPGETAQAHQANESASIQALNAAYEYLERFLVTQP
jgi:succinyl-diaminopimelate desuccinylase